MTNNLNQIIAQAVDGGKLAGVSACAMTAGGEIWAGAAGVANSADGTAMSTDTVLWIASMTKAVTGAAAMQLVEAGGLELDVPVDRWLPELAELQVLEGFSGDGAPQLRAANSIPTLRQLLTHTSGFGYDLWDARLLQFTHWQEAQGKGAPMLEPLIFEPGSQWAYGTGVDWAGRLVETVSGATLGEYLKEQFFEPLQMPSTGFFITQQMRSRLAPVQARTGPGEFVVTGFEIEQNPEHEMGGGGLYGTASDYLRFCRMILGGGALEGARVLQAETVAEMGRNQMGKPRMVDLTAAVADMTNDLAFYPGIEKTWGLSFMRNESATEHGRAPGTLAWAGLANTYYWIDPVAGHTGVWCTQLLPFNDATAVQHFHAFESAVRESA